jgi:hypothetical protein
VDKKITKLLNKYKNCKSGLAIAMLSEANIVYDHYPIMLDFKGHRINKKDYYPTGNWGG